MLSLSEANEIASQHLRTLSIQCQTELTLLGDSTIAGSEFFVYFYQSEEFITTGNSSARLAGNAPFLVNRKSGDIFTTGTALDLNTYIDQYRATILK